MRTKIEEKFKKVFDELLNRVRINEIVCFSNQVNENNWSVEDIRTYLEDSQSRNTLLANNAMCFFDSTLLQSPTAFTELDEIKEEFTKAYTFFENNIEVMCIQGEDIYTINELMKEYIKEIDRVISQMNFTFWWNTNDLNNKKGVLFLLVGKERMELKGLQIDIRALCGQIIDEQFKVRELVLKELKMKMVDIYSKFLVYPDINKIPTIKHDCSNAEISELIFALVNSEKIVDKIPLKTFLLELFALSSAQYSKSISDIKNRRIGRNKFLEKLIEQSEL